MMHDEMKPRMPVDDSEARMARSELYRAAKYSMKLFEMIQEGQELEGWVSAKITKSADYLDSVYHYMEYQAKFGQGGTATSLDDITSDAAVVVKGEVSEEDDEQMKESYELKLQALLEGAMKKAKAKKAEEKKDDKMDEAKIQASGVRATDKKKGKVEKSERKIYFVKLEKDNKVKGVTTQADEGETQGDVRDRVKRENMGWTVVSIREKATVDESKDADAKKDEEEKRKKEEKKKKIAKVIDEAKSAAQKAAQEKFKAMTAKKKGEGKDEKKVDEAKKGSKPDFLDLDKDGNKKEKMKDAAKNESRVDELSTATLQNLRQRRSAEAQHARDISQGTAASQYQDAQRGEAPPSDAEKAAAAALAKKRQAAADIAGYKLGKLSTSDPAKAREYAISKKVQAKQDAEWAAKQALKNSVHESAELSDILKLAGRKPLNG